VAGDDEKKGGGEFHMSVCGNGENDFSFSVHASASDTNIRDNDLKNSIRERSSGPLRREPGAGTKLLFFLLCSTQQGTFTGFHREALIFFTMRERVAAL
jgi:hypothetical protein